MVTVDRLTAINHTAATATENEIDGVTSIEVEVEVQGGTRMRVGIGIVNGLGEEIGKETWKLTGNARKRDMIGLGRDGATEMVGGENVVQVLIRGGVRVRDGLVTILQWQAMGTRDIPLPGRMAIDRMEIIMAITMSHHGNPSAGPLATRSVNKICPSLQRLRRRMAAIRLVKQNSRTGPASNLRRLSSAPKRNFRLLRTVLGLQRIQCRPRAPSQLLSIRWQKRNTRSKPPIILGTLATSTAPHRNLGNHSRNSVKSRMDTYRRTKK